MKLSVISSLALATAMLVSGNVYAQDATAAAPTMIGQQTLSAEDLPKVQAQCNTLGATEKESLATQDPVDTNGAEAPNGADQATTTIDLSLITVEDCKAAGLIQ